MRFAAPTVVNGKVYVSSYGGYLLAFGPAPQNTSPPSISGTAAQGDTLTESHGSWTNNPRTYRYRWEKCDSSGSRCSVIAGARKPKYTLRSRDAGHTIRVQEIAINPSGVEQAGEVRGYTRRLACSPLEQAPPLISGNATEGQALAETHRTLDQLPDQLHLPVATLRHLRHELFGDPRCDGEQYTLAAADVGHTIRVQETASNGRPSTAPATSAPTAAGQPASPPLTRP